MTTEYLTSVIMNQTIDMVSKGLRDLRSSTLQPFYDQPDPVPTGYANSAFPDVNAAMSSADLLAPSFPAFTKEMAQAEGEQLFLDFMGDCGLLQTETGDDLVEEDHSDSLPDLGSLGDLLARLFAEGLVSLDIERVREIASLVNIPKPPSQLKHLLIPDPDPIGELEPIIARRFARMRQYLRSSFSVE